jgi:hypothetical protein
MKKKFVTRNDEKLKHKLEEAKLSLIYKRAFADAKLFEQDKLKTHPIFKLWDEL